MSSKYLDLSHSASAYIDFARRTIQMFNDLPNQNHPMSINTTNNNNMNNSVTTRTHNTNNNNNNRSVQQAASTNTVANNNTNNSTSNNNNTNIPPRTNNSTVQNRQQTASRNQNQSNNDVTTYRKDTKADMETFYRNAYIIHRPPARPLNATLFRDKVAREKKQRELQDAAPPPPPLALASNNTNDISENQFADAAQSKENSQNIDNNGDTNKSNHNDPQVSFVDDDHDGAVELNTNKKNNNEPEERPTTAAIVDQDSASNNNNNEESNNIASGNKADPVPNPNLNDHENASTNANNDNNNSNNNDNSMMMMMSAMMMLNQGGNNGNNNNNTSSNNNNSNANTSSGANSGSGNQNGQDAAVVGSRREREDKDTQNGQGQMVIPANSAIQPEPLMYAFLGYAESTPGDGGKVSSIRQIYKPKFILFNGKTGVAVLNPLIVAQFHLDFAGMLTGPANEVINGETNNNNNNNSDNDNNNDNDNAGGGNNNNNNHNDNNNVPNNNNNNNQGNANNNNQQVNNNNNNLQGNNANTNHHHQLIATPALVPRNNNKKRNPAGPHFDFGVEFLRKFPNYMDTLRRQPQELNNRKQEADKEHSQGPLFGTFMNPSCDTRVLGEHYFLYCSRCTNRWPNNLNTANQCPNKNCNNNVLEKIAGNDLRGHVTSASLTFATGGTSATVVQVQRRYFGDERARMQRHSGYWCCKPGCLLNPRDDTDHNNNADLNDVGKWRRWGQCPLCKYFPPFFSLEDCVRSLAQKEVLYKEFQAREAAAGLPHQQK